MSAHLLAAIADTLLPGDGGLPSASKVGFDLATHAGLAEPIRVSIVALAGSEQAFIAGDEVQRTTMLQSVQRELPDAFGRLLAALLSDYYESPAVFAGFGWPSRPPQPEGHRIPGMDEATRDRLERVRLRRKIWRDET